MQPLRWFVKQNLAIQIFEGLLLGLAAGQLLPHSIVSLLAPIGDGFLRLFQMPVLPFLSLSLIAGVGRLNMDQAGRLLCCLGLWWCLLRLGSVCCCFV